MFKFQNLDTMGRAMLLKEQVAAKNHWRDCHRAQGLLLAYGRETKEVIQALMNSGLPGEGIEAWQRVKLHGETTLRKLHSHMDKLDKYLSYIDARLSDGTKWYTPQEVAAFLNEGDQHEFRGSHQETPDL